MTVDTFRGETIRLDHHGSLVEVLPRMTEALRQTKDPFRDRVVVQFRNGAFLELRQSVYGRTLRILRMKKPETDRALGMWLKEVSVFRQHLHIESWKSIPATVPEGIAAAFVERVGATSQLNLSGEAPA